MPQFIWKYSLTVSAPSGTRILQTEKLRVAFDIQKTLSSTPNKAVITVYGLSDNTRNNLNASTFNRVILRAGYPDNTDVIFDGQTTKTEVIKDPGEVMTKLTAGDGTKGITYGYLSVTIDGGTSLKDALKTIVKSMPNVSVGILQGVDNKVIPGRGQSFVGPASNALDAAGRLYGFSWSIQDGIFETVASIKGSGDTIGDAGKFAYVISGDTGMIGIPSIMDNGQIKVKALLNPRIKPGRVVNVRTKAVAGSGYYKVSEVTFKGDFRGQEWFVEIVGVPIKT